ncbi:Uncharacterized protein conserved in bacteria [Listeria grayi]|uniref:Uncharacterized protein n=1 Tax=Listeria grayi FSL F6-1183 TaxID=1265827 RepID=A0A829R3T5_LISGR|nr:DUF1128 domain-containing protein [Listeria grayi]EUJ26788.1 hypothetical protein LMUR_11887 [Listeria grayi FSL F6-1183]VEI33586.1 Uncharacterized protein conserved in bacteria [Listeria grayi]
MDLTNRTQENVDYMIKTITTKLKMVNAGVFENLQLENIHYDTLLDLYTLIDRKANFSPRDMQLFAEELKAIRK